MTGRLASRRLPPKVSVVLPVARWQPWLPLALDSLLEQRRVDLDIVVVGPLGAADDWSRHPPADKRIRWISRPAPGLVSALNTGLAEARGTWIARMDADDVSYPDRFAEQLEYLESHPDVSLCGTRVRMIDANGERDGVGEGLRRYEHWLNELTDPQSIGEQCFIENPLPHPTWMAHRDTWHELQGYRDGDFPEDHDLILRAWLSGLRFGKPEPVLLDWREHAERLTWQDRRYRREAFIRGKARLACDTSAPFGLASGRGVWICGVGRNARWWFDALLDGGATIRGFVDLDRPGARRSKRHHPVITYTTLWQVRGDDFLVSAISDMDARMRLQAEFDRHGLVAMQDYLLG